MSSEDLLPGSQTGPFFSIFIYLCAGVHRVGALRPHDVCGEQRTASRSLVLSSHHISPRNQTQGIRLGDRSHLAGPEAVLVTSHRPRSEASLGLLL